MKFVALTFTLLFWIQTVGANAPTVGLAERLTGIRSQSIELEQSLIDSLKKQKEAKSNIFKIKALMELQREERVLGNQRMTELEKTIGELEVRRGVLRERILVRQRVIRSSLMDIGKSIHEVPSSGQFSAREKIEAPRRKALALWVEHGLKDIETLRVDLADADQLEFRIQEEKQQLAYLFQDLKEQESVLELNRQLQGDLLRKKHDERVAQLVNYRNLKTAEAKVERLIQDFNARIELEHAEETERMVSKAMLRGTFGRLKGKLPMPVGGPVISLFGRAFDSKSNLYVFKKGVDISAGKNQPVHAVSEGKVAYSGELPNYGRVTIVDHGDHFYSLCANLGELQKKVGDLVAAGDLIGKSDDAGTPIYFEIRARNIAVNPLQWVSN